MTAAASPPPRVAYQGEPGAFSEDAVFAVFPQAQAVPRETIREAFEAVEASEATFAVVPLENSQAGSINETYEALLGSDRLAVVGEVVVPVDLALLGLPGATLEGIRRVSSHPQALAQCDAFLRRLGAEVVPAFDTAGAARTVAEGGRLEHAAVASVRAGRLLGLEVLAERIQTHGENATKFVVVGDPSTVDAASLGPPRKTSVVFAVADRPGSLFRCLQPFADRGLNLTKLESRPRRGRPFEYVFYLDLEAPIDAPGVADAVEDARAHTSLLKVLGSYPVLSR